MARQHLLLNHHVFTFLYDIVSLTNTQPDMITMIQCPSIYPIPLYSKALSHMLLTHSIEHVPILSNICFPLCHYIKPSHKTSLSIVSFPLGCCQEN